MIHSSMRTLALFAAAAALAAGAEVQWRPRMEVRLGSQLGQVRAVPVQTGRGAPPAVLLAYARDVEIDPYHEMFFYPTGTLRLALLQEGRIVWQRDLGRGVVPGIWFCPVFPFDLDGDGADEIWFVDNADPDHPLTLNGLRLARLDARDGKPLGAYPWPPVATQTMSHTYRNFILGGQVRGKPVLVTAQGTYGPMQLQGWNPDMTLRWETKIPDGPGPRGSHMTPVTDLDSDGVEEVLWGERAIEFDTGRQLFCADCGEYDGHSDIVQPLLDWARNRWYFFTCRENDPRRSPRVTFYDAAGARLWGDIDKGHMDVGLVAHLKEGEGPVAVAIRIGGKALGPSGLARSGMEEFAWDALSGKPRKPGFEIGPAIPADIDGDGYHELVRREERNGRTEILNAAGKVIATFPGKVACASKLLGEPGEQVLAFTRDGTVRIWGNENARDSERARRRYAHPFYRANQRLTANGYNLINLGGL